MITRILLLSLALIASTSASKYLLVSQDFSDARLPTNNRLLDFATTLRADNNEVAILSRGGQANAEFSKVMAQEGITFQPATNAQALFEREQYDAVFLPLWFWTESTVPETYQQTLAAVAPNTKVVVLTDDAHTERSSRIAAASPALAAARFTESAVADIRSREAATYQNADAVVSVSEDDASLIASLAGATPVQTVHFASSRTVKPSASIAPLSARNGISFVGYAGNPTNNVGLEWFFSQVFPLLPADLKAAPVHIVGSVPSDNFASLRASGANIVADGVVSEERMLEIVSSSRVMIAPIVASTGVNTKLYVGLASGTPVVSTSVAAAGLKWNSMADQHSAALSIADSAEEFASALVAAYTSPAVWSGLSSNGHAFAKQQVASGQFAADVKSLVSTLKAAPAKARVFSSKYIDSTELALRESTGRLHGGAFLQDSCGSDTCTYIQCQVNGAGAGVVCHHGTCSNHANADATCSCTSGWTGQYCETDINECSGTNPCQNGGTCSNNDGGYSCSCTSAWTGLTCTTANSCAGSSSAPTNGGAGACASTVTAGQSCLMTCNTGYTLTAGSLSRTCTAGSLTAISATCSLVTCAASSTAPTNGNAGNCNAQANYNGVCNVACNSGYQLGTGSTSRTCGSNGQWSTMTATCTASPCSAPAAPTNANSVAGTCTSASTYGNNCQIACATGYQLTSGSLVRVCQADGSWSAATAGCTAVTCAAIAGPTNGNAGTCGSIGSYPNSCATACNTGYSLSSGSHQRTCGSTGSWSSASPVCSPNACAAPAAPTNANTVASGCTGSSTYGQTCSIACATGYSLSSGSLTRSCQADGSWSTATAVCSINTCAASQSAPSNGNFGSCNAQANYLATCSVACNNGYTTSGSTTRTCGADGQWSQIAAQCAPVSCAAPAAPVNYGSIASGCTSSGTFGSTCSIACGTGFVFSSGSYTRSCQADGTWSTASLVCVGVTCPGSSTYPVNGLVGNCSVATTYPNTCLLGCKEGYSYTSGSLVRTCQSSGTYSTPTVTQCVAAATCAASSTFPTNGNVGTCGSSGRFQQSTGTCNVACNAGYYLSSGTLTRTCQSNSAWTAMTAVCTDINECSSNPCQNGATCTNGVNSFTCNCAGTGYAGATCSEPINECVANACGTNGECVDGINTFSCSCYTGWSGAKCATNVDDCAAVSSPCNGHGTCTDGLATYTCACNLGWYGATCGTNPNDCVAGACGAGTCVDGLNTYTCVCPTGYSGDGCATNIDDCANKPCGVGTCTDLINDYSCSCPADWSGDNCEISGCPSVAFQAKTTTLSTEHNSVDLDSTVKVVGSPKSTRSNTASSGAIFYFGATSGGAYTAATASPLYCPDTGAFEFGQDVAISGNYLAATAWKATVNSLSNAGQAYVFTKTGTGTGIVYTLQQRLTPTTNAASTAFGNAIAITSSYIVVGASSQSMSNSAQGAAYVYYNTGSGSAPWSTAVKLVHPSPANGDFFGSDVAVSGNTVVVSVRADTANSLSGAGTVVIFNLVSGTTNSWGTGVVIQSSTPTANGNFGAAIALHNNFLLVGEPSASVSSRTSGAAYVFTRSSSTASFVQQQRLFGSSWASGDLFGYSVAILTESYVAIGAPGVLSGRGSVSLFCAASGNLNLIQIVNASDPTASAAFGRGVALDGVYLAVNALSTGSYLYQQDGNQCFDSSYPGGNPCNYGTCKDGLKSYTCSCNAGYSGTQCNVNINECSPNPCKHGSCIDGVNSYTCVCESGFQGKNCSDIIPVACTWIGPTGGGTDAWCNVNCNREIPYCPASSCSCPDGLPAMGQVGCSDGTREAFRDRTTWQNIAGCNGGWTVPGVQSTQDLVPRCDRKSGNDGTALTGCSAADICEEGWHVCASPIDVANSVGSNLGCKANSDWPAGTFYATRTSGNGDGNCNMAPEWANDIFGCGTIGDNIYSTATGCTGLTKFTYNSCTASSLNGMGWACADKINGWGEAAELTHTTNTGGLLCCKDGTAAAVPDNVVNAGPICEGGNAYLSCPYGTTINVMSAEWGRQDTTVCTRQFGVSSYSTSQFCSSSSGNPLNKVIALCKGKQTCNFAVSDSALNGGVNPCGSGVRKYFKASYNCINPDGTTSPLPPQMATPTISSGISAPTGSTTQVNNFGPVCEGNTVDLFCPTGYVIQMKESFYGRMSTSICPTSYMGSTTCNSTAALPFTTGACNGQQSCTVWSSANNFGDPCPGSTKYMTGAYYCTPNQSDSWKMAVCSNPGTILQLQLYIDPASLPTYLALGAFVGTCSSRRTLTITLDVDFSSIPDINAFLSVVLADLYLSAGVDPSVGVFFVTSWKSGSLVLSIDVYPGQYPSDPVAPTIPSLIVDNIVAQQADPSSVYNQGVATSSTSSITVTVYDEDDDGSSSSGSKKTSRGLAIGLGVAAAVIVVAGGSFFAMKHCGKSKRNGKVGDSFDAATPSFNGAVANGDAVPAAAPSSSVAAPGASHKASNETAAPTEQEHLWVLERTV